MKSTITPTNRANLVQSTRHLKRVKPASGMVEVEDAAGDKKISEIYGYPLINNTTGEVQGVIEYRA